MKFVPMISLGYFSLSAVYSFFDPSLFVPITVVYVLGVGEYEILNGIEKRWGK